MIAIAARDLALLLGITFIWGLNLIICKIGVSEIPPLLFTALRFLIVALLMFPFLRVRRGQMSALVVAALLTGTLHFGMSFVALSIADNVSSVAIAGQLGVPFTTLLSVALLGEIVRWRRWTGVLLAFAGVLIMGFDGQMADEWPSLALMAGSSFASSLGLIAVKKLHGFRPATLQAWFALISMPCLLGASIVFEPEPLASLRNASFSAWGAVAFTAIAASMLAHTGFYHLVQRYPVNSVAPLTVLSPVFSIVLGVLLLDDRVTSRIAIGGACTLLGVLIIMLRERRIVDTAT